jgi:excisionase family DNA binding protein
MNADRVVVVVDNVPHVVPRVHLTRAVAAHASWCRTNAIPSAAIVPLLDALSAPEGTKHDRSPGGPETELMKTFLTPTEAAARFGVSVKTIRRRVKDGTLPAVYLGRHVRIPVSAVAA